MIPTHGKTNKTIDDENENAKAKIGVAIVLSQNDRGFVVSQLGALFACSKLSIAPARWAFSRSFLSREFDRPVGWFKPVLKRTMLLMDQSKYPIAHYII
jgi:hypothetical protein